MTCGVVWRCSEAYRLQDFYQQTQDQLQARREALQSSSQPDRPVVDGDVTVMAVKFERSVFIDHGHAGVWRPKTAKIIKEFQQK